MGGFGTTDRVVPVSRDVRTYRSMLGYIHAGSSPELSSCGVIAMEANLKRITLELDTDTARRLMSDGRAQGDELAPVLSSRHRQGTGQR